MSTDSLIDSLIHASDPMRDSENAGMMHVSKVLEIVRQHQAEQPQDVAYRNRELIRFMLLHRSKLHSSVSRCAGFDEAIKVLRRCLDVPFDSKKDYGDFEVDASAREEEGGSANAGFATSSANTCEISDNKADQIWGGDVTSDETDDPEERAWHEINAVLVSYSYAGKDRIDLADKLWESIAPYLRTPEPVSSAPVSLEKCARQLGNGIYQEHFDDAWRDCAGLLKDYAKAVLDAAGVKYE